MPAVAFVLPLIAGKSEQDREAMTSCWKGDRKHDFERSRKNAGITREAVYIQQTPAGDVVVLYMEADDIGAAFHALGTSDDPFDHWFRDHVREVHGINMEDPFPLPEQILDFGS